MLNYQFTLVLLITSILLISAQPTNRIASDLRDAPRRVNCWKYVFAPVCRGVASKRIVSDINEMAGDDPEAYTDEANVVSNENHIKNVPEGQDRLWFLEKHFENRIRTADPEYESLMYPRHLVSN